MMYSLLPQPIGSGLSGNREQFGSLRSGEGVNREWTRMNANYDRTLPVFGRDELLLVRLYAHSARNEDDVDHRSPLLWQPRSCTREAQFRLGATLHVAGNAK